MARHDPNEFFDNWRDGPSYSDEQITEERPIEKIQVRIRLNQSGNNQSSVLRNLKKELTSHNMDLTPSESSNDIVIISGIPPDNGFGAEEVLEVVQKHFPAAELA